MFIRKEYILMGIFLLCVVGAGCFILTAGAGKSKGKAEITWLYPPKYYSTNAFSEGRVWVREERDGPWSLLDDQGHVLKTGLKASRVSEYENGIASFWPPLLPDGSDDPSGCGFLNLSGDVLLQPGTYDGISGPYREGLIGRKGKNGLYGFIDLSGTWVIPPAYDEVYRFQEGLSAVIKDNKIGFIDKKGAVVIDFKFNGAFQFSHKMAPVQVGSKWGVIDPTGRWIAEPVYEKPGGTDWSELMALQKDGKIGFIDNKGKVVIKFRFLRDPYESYSFIYRFNKGRAIAILEKKDPGFGIIGESGKVLFWREGCEFFLLGDYILCVNSEGERSLLDRKNREYDVPDDFQLLNPWVDPDEKSPYPFMGIRDGKTGYFTISVSSD